jgi:hypothetical protein
MKKFILAATAMSMMASPSAANSSKCKYEKDEIDASSQVNTLATKWNVISRTLDVFITTRVVRVSAVTQGDDDYLDIKFEDTVLLGYAPYEDELRDWFVVPQEAPLMILMVDGTIVELAAHRKVSAASWSVSADTQDSDGGTDKVRHEINSKATIRYPLDAESFSALTSQGATRVRLSTQDKHFEFDVDKKSVNDFQHALHCLKAEAS